MSSVHHFTAVYAECNGQNNSQFTEAATIDPFLPLTDEIFMTNIEQNIF